MLFSKNWRSPVGWADGKFNGVLATMARIVENYCFSGWLASAVVSHCPGVGA
ncbi:hypothetical protein [Synechocystis salina]|uniref:hypothetical protein n=1 Tax=Synechocystis salina TaxID=945780 RepID=UPI001D13B792|nr:hypothetical protein [Synechocystis salina]